MNPSQTTAVNNLKGALVTQFGERLLDVVVFGSVARGTDTASSDIDVMIVLRSPSPEGKDWLIEKQVRSIAFDVELEHGVVFDMKVLSEGALHSELGHTPFVERVLAEGVHV